MTNLLPTFLPLNNGTKGFRWQFLGLKGTFKIRKLRRTWKLSLRKGPCTYMIEIYPIYISVEHGRNRSTARRFRRFAG
jgi:hypothetical protein